MLMPTGQHAGERLRTKGREVCFEKDQHPPRMEESARMKEGTENAALEYLLSK